MSDDRRRRSRSRPGVWSRPRIPRRWRRGIAPDPRDTPSRFTPRLTTRVRRLLLTWWPWAVACVVAIALHRWGWAAGTGAVAMICFITWPSEGPPRYGLDHDFDVSSEEFLHTVAGATGVPMLGGHTLEFLNNGDEFYPRMLADLGEARTSVCVEAYIYWAGDIGQRFAEVFAAKAQAGVPVKILLDAVGSASIGSRILETLEKGGCQLAWYNPLRWRTLGRFNHRTHRKSLIVDGTIAYTGGAGIADIWAGHAQDRDHWRDMQVRVVGPAVTALQGGFSENWLQSTGELIAGEGFYPGPADAGRLAIMTIMSSPEAGASSVRVMYYLSIAAARRSIHIANPYFVPDEVAVRALTEAKRRGVRVRIMVAGIPNDAWLARQNSVRLYGLLLDAGIEILEYNRTMMHQKTMVVDGVWATIGTANFDNRSFAHNEENNLCFRDPSLAAELDATFERDAATCNQVTLEAWRRRGAWARVTETMASLFEDQA